MRVKAAEVLDLEERLVAGEPLSSNDQTLVLMALEHLRTCPTVAAGGGRPRRRPTKRGHRRRPRGKPKGHGRNGADDYKGAQLVECPHPDHRPGDTCPNPGCIGHLYHAKVTGDIELKAGPLVKATRYQRDVLRCSSCQATFTAPLPDEAHGAKFHPSVDAAISIARFEMGMAHNRMARWQEWSGVPLPASTQFERAENMANVVLPIFLLLTKLAANQRLLYSDDTSARILSLAKENESRGPNERTGIFTTSIVARDTSVKSVTIVLFRSGRNHEGENMARLLEKRRAGAQPPLYMSDATSRKPTHSRVACKCLTHARQKLVETHPVFPEKSERVLDTIGAVYEHEDATAGMDTHQRLAYHQQHSGPLMADLKEWIDAQFEQRLVEPNGRLGKALKYLKRHWEGLTQFLRVPGAPLDNNVTERQLKMSVRHRKNSLFFRNEAGAAIADVLMSVIRTCVVNGIDPGRFLTAVGLNSDAARATPQDWLPWTYQDALRALN